MPFGRRVGGWSRTPAYSVFCRQTGDDAPAPPRSPGESEGHPMQLLAERVCWQAAWVGGRSTLPRRGNSWWGVPSPPDLGRGPSRSGSPDRRDAAQAPGRGEAQSRSSRRAMRATAPTAWRTDTSCWGLATPPFHPRSTPTGRERSGGGSPRGCLIAPVSDAVPPWPAMAWSGDAYSLWAIENASERCPPPRPPRGTVASSAPARRRRAPARR